MVQRPSGWPDPEGQARQPVDCLWGLAGLTAGGRVWHRQVWEFPTLAQAEAWFQQLLRQKTNPLRRRRQYRLENFLPAASMW